MVPRCHVNSARAQVRFLSQDRGDGRKAIFEALIVDDEVKVAIQDGAPALQLRRILENRGEASLFEKAVREAADDVIALDQGGSRTVTRAGASVSARLIGYWLFATPPP